MIQFVWGAISMGSFIVGLFFLRFWRDTRDRFFAIFALAFWMLAIERVILMMIGVESELRTWVYIIRLMAFALILIAIVQKNISQDRQR